MKVNQINSFTGDYSYLSNFYGAAVYYEGLIYETSEHAFQAAKTNQIEIRHKFTYGHVITSTAAKAKALGKRVPLRDNWDYIKIGIMEEICYLKFTQNPLLGEKLVMTGNAHLEEGNRHGDKFWGTVRGEGRNELGRILMRVRSKIISNGRTTNSK